MPDERPNPDLLLAQIQQEEGRRTRGRLKVFFGAAPGVGKTYAMLEEGRAKAAEGADVLVGYAEPHIRTDTEALLLGMELLPYKIVDYRGIKLKEFDLDAALARRPALILIDELAHSNSPGMRHAKRYQDVQELLDAGIDVYTTLNVQHLESVNDIVERITGAKVRETLPDSVLDEADEVELVDTSPEELLVRLREGKVYVPDKADRALRNFFSKGNLLALRELALRRTAERVDVQMRDFRRTHAVRETWPAAERILVSVGPSPLSARLVRAARRMAAGLNAEWIAAYVEKPDAARMSQRDRDRVNQNLRLAEQLGARTVTLSGEDVADEIIAYAHAHNVTKLVIGKSDEPRWKEFLFGSVVDDLVRRSGDIDVYIIRGREEETIRRSVTPGPRAPIQWRSLLPATLIIAACTGLSWLMWRHFELSNLIMVYLLGVVTVAALYDRAVAAYASILSVLAFDFFFVPPYYTFAVADGQYFVTFGVMLVTALIISTLTDRIRQQAVLARERERRTTALLDLSRELAGTRGLDGIAKAAVRHVCEVFACQDVLLTQSAQHHLEIKATSKTDLNLDEKERSVAQWVFEHDQPAGSGTSTLPAASGLYLPLVSSRRTAGVLGIFPSRAGQFHDPEQMHLLEAFANQAALAIERAMLAEEAQQAWERIEAELIRNTLLSGVSHDLRTPLAGILGAASSLLESNLPPEAQREMLQTISGEADRMDRLINNLLDMTRLESGGLQLKKDWHSIQELIGAALHRLDNRLRGRDVKVCMPEDLPMIPMDDVAIEQVLINILDNAAEYTPAGTPIEITAAASADSVTIDIADHGPGLPPENPNRVFEKFYRGPAAKNRRGIGLGLAICQGIIHAHGGTISAINRAGGGAVFRMTLPIQGSPPTADTSA